VTSRYCCLVSVACLTTTGVATIPARLAAQVVLAPAQRPDGRQDLRNALAISRSEDASLATRYVVGHPLRRQVGARIIQLQDSLGHLGYTAAVLELRDSLEIAEQLVASALGTQERAPRAALRAAAVRDDLRHRYCASAPPEPYCGLQPIQPILPIQPRGLRPSAG